MRLRWASIRRNYFLLLIIVLAVISCGASPDRTTYSNTSNKELKQRALRLVKNIRELVESYNKKARALNGRI
jgi:hypothetical protein